MDLCVRLDLGEHPFPFGFSAKGSLKETQASGDAEIPVQQNPHVFPRFPTCDIL